VNGVNKINEKNGEVLVLRGVELGEAFWFPDAYEKIMKINEYDVVIGSVHAVKFPALSNAYYSTIDFSKVEKGVIEDYLDAYFDDMISMISALDFDILAHLNCPLRYIKGKYKVDVDMSGYEAKIEKILHMIIEKGIALEVNTSGYFSVGEPMPSFDIIRKYYSFGGRLVTLGSDAHVAQNASHMFCETISELKKIGFDSIYYYKERKPCAIPI
jgi:histidinol-phosphatase (PHP family)